MGVVGPAPDRVLHELERAERVLGRATSRLTRGLIALAAWPNESGVPALANEAFALEGWLDRKVATDASPWPARVVDLEGDFALIAPHGEQIIAVSGRGMGYRPLYVGQLDDDVAVVCSRLD